MTFTCTIPGFAIPQDRPRIIRRGKHAGLKDTDRVMQYKADVRMAISQRAPEKLFDGPLSMSIDIFVLKPASWPKKRIHACTKPDADNFCKLICDCCEGIVYTNDSRIVDLRVRKHLAEKPEVRLVVTELTETDSEKSGGGVCCEQGEGGSCRSHQGHPPRQARNVPARRASPLG